MNKIHYRDFFTKLPEHVVHRILTFTINATNFDTLLQEFLLDDLYPPNEQLMLSRILNSKDVSNKLLTIVISFNDIKDEDIRRELFVTCVKDPPIDFIKPFWRMSNIFSREVMIQALTILRLRGITSLIPGDFMKLSVI